MGPDTASCAEDTQTARHVAVAVSLMGPSAMRVMDLAIARSVAVMGSARSVKGLVRND